MASGTDTQSLALTVSPITELAISGGPIAMEVSAATAGSDPTPVDDTSSTYAVTTNGSGQKITGALGLTNLPDGVTLKITLAAPGGEVEGGTHSAGAVALSGTAADLVTGITKLSATGVQITYTLAATAAAGVYTGETVLDRTVTLTLMDVVTGP
jgi:hypothetical protein